MKRLPARVRVGERGIALAAALFVLVALAALLAGLWFAALQEYRVGANVVSDRRAFDAAEAGLDAALAGWDAGALKRLTTGDTAAFAGALGGGAAGYSGVIQRLGPGLFLIQATGFEAGAASRRSLALVARIAPLRLGVAGALVSSGPVRIADGGIVDGLTADTGTGCGGPAGEAAGVVLGDAGDLTLSACAGGGCLRGNPGSRVDTALRNAPVPLLGDTGWERLVAAADTVAPDGVPVSAAPVWLAPGDFTLPVGTDAGPVVLLVQGDLVVEAGARLTGLVVVRGRLLMRGAGGSLTGSVLAGGADLAASGGARATVAYSRCAVVQALASAAPARPLNERPWTTVYGDGH